MEKSFWQSRWRSGTLGFHQSEVNRHLADHVGFLAEAGGRVLVPLCGKSRDLTFLAGHFDEVVGVEFVQQASDDYYAENDGAGVTILVADMLAVRPADVGDIAAVFDRAAMIALEADKRAQYAEQLRGLAGPGARLLLITLEYDQALTHGPPFSVDEAEVRRLFADWTVVGRERQRPERLPPRFDQIEVNKSIWRLAAG